MVSMVYIKEGHLFYVDSLILLNLNCSKCCPSSKPAGPKTSLNSNASTSNDPLLPVSDFSYTTPHQWFYTCTAPAWSQCHEQQPLFSHLLSVFDILSLHLLTWSFPNVLCNLLCFFPYTCGWSFMMIIDIRN